MGAVRNSNTRASHASVETAGAIGAVSSSPAAGVAAAGDAAKAGGAVAADAALGAEPPLDRRPSFSYLRRASDRRRRRRLLERGLLEDPALAGEGPSTPRHAREFQYGGRSHRLDSESGTDSGNLRRTRGGPQHAIDTDNQSESAQMGAGQRHGSNGSAGRAALRRADGMYDDSMTEQQQHRQQMYGTDAESSAEQHAGGHRASADEQRRQSINDRLTDAVSDVMEFVRDESIRRGKRHSLVRRRAANRAAASAAPQSPMAPGVLAGTPVGASGARLHEEDEVEMDSEEVMSSTAGGGGGPRYNRRKRITRRGERRAAASPATPLRPLNDSDTGSVASLSMAQQQQQPPAHLAHPSQLQESVVAAGPRHVFGKALPLEHQLQQQHHHQHQHHMQQRFRLQQHGGSMQDAHMYPQAMPMQQLSGGMHRGTAMLLDQHRKHQSADACASQHQEYMDKIQANIRPIPVGASPPPPLPGSFEAELLAARRKREQGDLLDPGVEEDDETAIHVRGSPEQDVVEQAGGVGAAAGSHFVAPRVASLQSPSAMLCPDEEIVPPSVPFRGRRLPQIPGTGMLKSAADFLQTSFYGRSSEFGGQAGGSLGSLAASATAARYAGRAGMMVGGSLDEHAGAADADAPSMFPSVCESPSGKLPHDTPAQAAAAIVKRAGGPSALVSAAASEHAGSSGSINFPRVSFSPTHVGAAPVGASLIATQTSASGATQTSLLAGGSAGPAAASSAPGAQMLHRRPMNRAGWVRRARDDLISGAGAVALDETALDEVVRSNIDEENDNWF